MILDIVQAIILAYTYYKGIKQYRKLNSIYLKLKENPLVDVSQAVQFLKNKKSKQKFFVILKGIVKAKKQVQDNNILSIIQITDLRQNPPHLNVFKKISWDNLINKPFWMRPWNLKNIQFNLKDINTNEIVQVSNCQKSHISGALTQIYAENIIFQKSTNFFVIVFKSLYNFFSSFFPFNLILKKIRYGEEMKYFSIMDGQFVNVIGQIYKNKKGQHKIIGPFYITKQKGFIQKKLLKKMKHLKWLMIVASFLVLYLGYKLGKLVFKQFLKKKIQKMQADEQQKRSDNEGQNCNCIICYTNIRSIVIKPCRHYGFCKKCYEQLNKKKCPICKCDITGIIQIIKK